MNFLRSKGEHLADHLRECIHRGEVLEPLPGTRAWSRTLGVDRKTLDRALGILRREGLVTVQARGYRLNRSAIKRVIRTATPRVVYMLYYARHFQNLHVARDWVFLLLERLHEHGIRLHLERCGDVRLRTLAHRKQQPNELFYLTTFNRRHQLLFAQARKSALVLGSPARGVGLPYITPDPISSVTHATQLLLRSGFRRLHLLLTRPDNPAVHEARAAFETACGGWPHQPVSRQTVFMPVGEKRE